MFIRKVMLVAGMSCIAAGPLTAAVPFTFSNGSPADATQVNANFSDLDTRLSALEGGGLSMVTVDCATDDLQAALDTAALTGPTEITLSGVCTGNYVISDGSVISLQGNPGAGLTADVANKAALEVNKQAAVTLDGLTITGTDIGLLITLGAAAQVSNLTINAPGNALANLGALRFGDNNLVQRTTGNIFGVPMVLSVGSKTMFFGANNQVNLTPANNSGFENAIVCNGSFMGVSTAPLAGELSIAGGLVAESCNLVLRNTAISDLGELVYLDNTNIKFAAGDTPGGGGSTFNSAGFLFLNNGATLDFVDLDDKGNDNSIAAILNGPFTRLDRSSSMRFFNVDATFAGPLEITDSSSMRLQNGAELIANGAITILNGSSLGSGETNPPATMTFNGPVTAWGNSVLAAPTEANFNNSLTLQQNSSFFGDASTLSGNLNVETGSTAVLEAGSVGGNATVNYGSSLTGTDLEVTGLLSLAANATTACGGCTLSGGASVNSGAILDLHDSSSGVLSGLGGGSISVTGTGTVSGNICATATPFLVTAGINLAGNDIYVSPDLGLQGVDPAALATTGTGNIIVGFCP